MNYKQWAAGLGGVLAGAVVGGAIAGRQGVEAGTLIAAIVGLGVGAQKPEYSTAANVAVTAGLATSVGTWGFAGGGRKHLRGAMETAMEMPKKIVRRR